MTIEFQIFPGLGQHPLNYIDLLFPLYLLDLIIVHPILTGTDGPVNLVTDNYFGTPLGELIGGGVATGSVYIADEHTLFIKRFNFAGSAYPFTNLQVGHTPYPDGNGAIVPDDRGT